MGKQRRLVLTGLTLTLVLLMAAGVTSAGLHTITNEKINDLGFGQTEITVDEGEVDWTQKEVKLSTAIGEGYAPGVARVMFIPYVLADNGVDYVACDLGAMQKPVDGKMTLGDIVLEFAENWEDDWFYQDGFFYYRQVLYPEEGQNETSVLLKKVSLAGDADDIAAIKEKYAEDQIKIEVMSSILQAEGGAEENWGVHVEGGVVSP